MSKINVLQLMTDSKIGGAEKVVLWLAKGFDKEKFNVKVCCLAKRGPIFNEIEKEGIEIFSLGMGSKWDLFKAFGLIKILRRENIHILHSHLFHANLLGRIIGKFAGVPIVISCEHIMGMESWWRLFLNRITSPFVVRFIAVSFKVGEFLINSVNIKRSKVTVVQNGIELEGVCRPIDTENKKKEIGISKDDLVIGTVARIHRQKGHVFLLQAAREIINNFPNVKFLIVGDGPLKKKMERIADDLGISKKIIFTGFCGDIPGIMSIFDVFALSSLWEGLPITILEAMAMRKPVVATNVSGNPEVVVDGETGVLVSPRDYQGLALALTRLLNDKDLRCRMGNAGYERVKELFGAKRMVADTEEIYRELLQKKHKC